MITQAQIDKFNEIHESEGRVAADAYAQPIINTFGLDVKGRGKLWDIFREKTRAARLLEEDAKKQAEKQAKKEAKKNKVSIKKICEALLEKFGLSDYERKFLSDIKTKRKLTAKQESWLRDLASKHNIEMKGVIENKAKRSENISCQHDDLGSLGYVHGTTVKCPHCGQMAEVW